MEKIDIYDEFMQKTGKTSYRFEHLNEDEFRRVMHVCIFNSKGEMLIQKRSPKKQVWSGFWDLSVGGGVISGETIKDAAHRETLEELGIDIDFSSIQPFLTSHFKNGFDDFFVINKDIDISELKLDNDEVTEVKWASLEEILNLQKDINFVTFAPSFIELLFYYSKTGSIIDDTNRNFNKK